MWLIGIKLASAALDQLFISDIIHMLVNES